MTEPDPDMLAAELALGLLDGEERAEALRRVLADPAFARDVEWWREQLSGLFEEYPEVPAPEGLIDRIGEPLVQAPAPRTRSLWPVLSALSALAAVVILFFAMRVPVAPTQTAAPPHEMMLAALAPTDKNAPPISAMIDRGSGEVRVAAADLAPPGKVAQLWMIKDGVPHSMGLLRSRAATRLTIPPADRAALGAGITLAVSIEPPGGSPKPTPTGPVIASGPLSLT